MKKTKKTAAIAAAFIAAMNLNACAYGPPETYNQESADPETSSSITETETKESDAATEPIDFVVDEEEIQEAYGPPVWME